MQNSDIALSSGFNVTRVTKSGKVQTRSILGVISSGNREERDTIVLRMVQTLIPNNSFGMVMQELTRVFPATQLAAKLKKGESAAVGSLVNMNGDLWFVEDNITMRQFDATKSDAVTVRAVCNAIVAKNAGKELKGEKAAFMQVARACLEHFERKEQEKAEAENPRDKLLNHLATKEATQ